VAVRLAAADGGDGVGGGGGEGGGAVGRGGRRLGLAGVLAHALGGRGGVIHGGGLGFRDSGGGLSRGRGRMRVWWNDG
jgi:hypothetical protein